jgi:putative PIN family toxin of toxin-antitoxin system
VRIVLDTNVWLDWLVFEDAALAPLKRAHEEGWLQIVIDEACAEELERVLSYDIGKWTLDAAGRKRCVDAFRLLCFSQPAMPEAAIRLPLCADPDDQKFLQLAAAACADALVTKDLELLRLAQRRLPFRIVKPAELLA